MHPEQGIFALFGEMKNFYKSTSFKLLLGVAPMLPRTWAAVCPISQFYIPLPL